MCVLQSECCKAHVAKCMLQSTCCKVYGAKNMLQSTCCKRHVAKYMLQCACWKVYRVKISHTMNQCDLLDSNNSYRLLTLVSSPPVSSVSAGNTWMISGCSDTSLGLGGTWDFSTSRARPPEGSSNSSVPADTAMMVRSWGMISRMARWQEMSRGGGMIDTWWLLMVDITPIGRWWW